MKVCKRNLAGILIIALMLCLTVNNRIKFAIKEESSSQVNAEINDKNDEKNPKDAESFIPDPDYPHDGTTWNFTTGEIIGWSVNTDYSTRDMIFNISDLKYFTAMENITGKNAAYYGVQLTPSYYNISTHQVQEFTNRTIFPLLNASLINYTLTYEVFSIENLIPFSFQENMGPEYFLNLFVPKNSSNVLDIHWVANALHWWYSIFINGNFDEYGDLNPPQNPSELCDVTITSNSILYSNPSKGTYCNLQYYDNGTLRTGELKGLFMPEMTLTINWTRFFDYDPLNEVKWSENFDAWGEIIYMGIDTNETKLVFDHTEDNMELEIEWNEEWEEWDVQIIYFQELWANFSNWNYDDKKWEYINCTVVASANEIYPVVFGASDNNNDEEMSLPPFLLIPNQSTILGLGDIFKMFELNPEWSDLRVDYGSNWVKLTNTTSSNIVVFSYQTDGILQYIYIQDGVGPFVEMTKDRGDKDILFYYKNNTDLLTGFNTLPLHTFDLKSLSAVINISLSFQSGFFHSGFPYNPTNQSIDNAIGFFDLFIPNEGDLDQTYFAPINITFYYDHTTYKSVKVYWFNTSADNHKGAWEEIPIKNLGDGVIVVTLNHTSIIVFTASKIVSIPSDGDDGGGGEEKKPAIPFGNYYLIFMALAIIGLVIYKKRNL